LDARLLRADAGKRQRRHDVDVRRKRPAGLGRGPLEDQRLLRDRVEVDLLLLDPRRAREPARRLAALHRDRGDRPDPGALDAVEAEAGNPVVEGAAELTADRAETDDAHVHDGRMLSCLRYWNDGSARPAAAARAPLS